MNRAFRFQADIDPKTGLFASGSLYDQFVVNDPVSDEEVGAFSSNDPTKLTAVSHPDLFAALNVIASKSDERIQAKRSAFLAARSAAPIITDMQ